jgi:Uncharacterised protein family (UPF0160)
MIHQLLLHRLEMSAPSPVQVMMVLRQQRRPLATTSSSAALRLLSKRRNNNTPGMRNQPRRTQQLLLMCRLGSAACAVRQQRQQAQLAARCFSSSSSSSSSSPLKQQQRPQPQWWQQQQQEQRLALSPPFLPPPAAKAATTIGTHGGRFHANEAMGCWMLLQLPRFRHAQIVRTDDVNVLHGLDAAVGVGGRYDPKTHRYDDPPSPSVRTTATTTAAALYGRASSGGSGDDVDDGECTASNERLLPLPQKLLPRMDYKSNDSRPVEVASPCGRIYQQYGRDVLLRHYPHLNRDDLERSYVTLYGTIIRAMEAIARGIGKLSNGDAPIYR